MEKKKIQVGVTCYFDPNTKEEIKSEPIYKDWTPKLQEGYNNMFENFANAISPLIQKFYQDPKNVAKYEEWLKNRKL